MDTLAEIIGGRNGLTERSGCEEFKDDGIKDGYDRTSVQARTITDMIQQMHRPGHLGAEFLKEQNISN